MPSKLLNYLKYLFNVTGILAQYSAFQHKCVSFIRSIPYVPKSMHSLVCINFDDGNIPNLSDPHIGYL